MPREKLSYAQKQCVGLTGKLMQRLAMIGPGSRIGIAASGGEDSFTLLEVLRRRQRIVPFRFEIIALHINPGFDAASHAPLTNWLSRHGVPGHIDMSDHGPRAHSDENRNKSACFYCAMLRRRRLFELAQQYNLTHLAFGHNADDLVHTFFMNMLQTGRTEGMTFSEPFFRGRLQIIRPLGLVEKRVIHRAARQWDLPVWANDCPSAGKTMRSDIADHVHTLTQNKLWRVNMFRALTRWQIEQDSTPEKMTYAGAWTGIKAEIEEDSGM